METGFRQTLKNSVQIAVEAADTEVADTEPAGIGPADSAVPAD